MKKVTALALLLLVMTPAAFAIDFIWKDDTGVRIYDCGGHAVGGQAKIKALGEGLYRARGVRINRVIRANSVYHAAQIVCGEKPEYESAPQQTPPQE